ncbi:pesticin C-terminus-like muramidase [Vibrio sp. ZSDZ65]|uniref:Pesticin C-terminus-like muramidase n=1 Tax=Vibrio qingdaonensis TaxID=2829491 RepID=A0A9X3CQ11_9VIBR|nr:pesticin C-terminus-like muramidase [Vibrio qingdaonensis]MCW8347427.1 pesticin C-terminus-like muramidase [Vibrio qingdaonensis]
MAFGDGEALSNGSKGLEVKVVQEALIELGFDLGPAGADGDFGKATESAITQFQKGYEPTHNTHETYKIGEVDGIVDKNTALALDEGVSENWQYIDDAMDEKWLTVPKGQFTFDNEGDDIESSAYFSRKAHVPHNSDGVVIGQSGVTIGRGLDSGNPPTGATGQSPSKLHLKELFQVSELTSELSDWLLSVEGVKKESALELLNNSSLESNELTLTRKQQHLMFNTVYEYMEEKTRILLTKSDVQAKFGVVDWASLPLNVKEVLVDLTYRGDNSPRTREGFVPALVDFDILKFKKIMFNSNNLWVGVDLNRRLRREKHL